MTLDAPPAPCPCCGAALTRGLRAWHRRCGQCRYEGVVAPPAPPLTLPAPAGRPLDEAGRAAALQPLRQANAALLLALLRPRLPARAEVLDVGCAHGWFLEAAGSAFHATGLEPDAPVAARARARGLAVRIGAFPQDLAATERYDALVFNDVFEHLADAPAALSACHRHLRDDGWLLLNLPNAEGLYYRWACRLARLGFTGPWRRLWQVDLPSPHLHYFTPHALRALVERHGFTLAAHIPLPAVTAAGLYGRVRYARGRHVWSDLAGFIGAAALLPFARTATSDAMVLLFRRCAAGASGVA